jgi:hypothetical protein
MKKKSKKERYDIEHNANIGLDYEKELEKFYGFDGDNIQTEYVLNEYDVGLDTTIRSVKDLKEMMGNEYQHIINHLNKNKDS